MHVFEPPDYPTGEIPERVFELIDESDLAILDVSGPQIIGPDGAYISRASPNVIYELALLHGLGVPVIPVALRDHPKEFYLNSTGHAIVDNFGVQTLFEKLDKWIRSLIFGDGEDLYSNPISRYYDDIPLVDISSAMGLATGFFFNYLTYMISISDNIFQRLEKTEHATLGLKHIVLLKSDRIEEVKLIKTQLQDILKSRGTSISGIHEKEEVKGRRRFSFDYIGPYIVDVLTPISSMAISPRYKRARRKIAQMADRGMKMDINASDRIAKYDKQIIESFIKALRRYSRAPNVNRKLFTIMNVPEFVKKLEREKHVSKPV